MFPIMEPFNESSIYHELASLAKTAPDLTSDRVLNPVRVQQYVAEACGFKLLYATERVDSAILQKLSDLAKERNCFSMMEKMQAGDVINCIEGFPSENRAVLHTSLRDFFDASQAAKPAKEAAELALSEINRLKLFLDNLSPSFQSLVIVGIGGSELGPKALYLALEAYKKPEREVRYVGNIDPDDLQKALRGLDLAKTLICIVSKSGKTQETCVNEEFARSYFLMKGLVPASHFLAITSEGSPLDDASKYLAVFHMWDWIGGRYSASSVIGGLIIGFSCGFDTYWELLKGAHEMDRHAIQERDPLKNLPLLAALLGIWNHNFLHIETTAVIPYSQALWRFTAHLQQLDMESNGKQNDRQGRMVDFMTGPIVWGEAGTNAQHSFFQLIHQGKAPIALEFIGFAGSQLDNDFVQDGTSSQQKLLANLLAQVIALATGLKSQNPNQQFFGNRPSFLLFGKKLTPKALGALLAFYEHKVAFQGFIWNINSFDQEGVQLGKVLAGKILERFNNQNSFPLADAYITTLDL